MDKALKFWIFKQHYHNYFAQVTRRNSRWHTQWHWEV